MSKALRPQSPHFAVSALKRAELLKDELNGKETSLLLANEKGVLEKCVQALIEREKQETVRKETALREWALLDEKEAEEMAEANQANEELVQAARTEDNHVLAQGRTAVAATVGRVEDKIKALRHEMEDDIQRAQEELQLEQQEAKLALVEFEEDVLQRIQNSRNERWSIYEHDVQQLQNGLTTAKEEIQGKILGGRDEVRLAEAGVMEGKAWIAKEQLSLDQHNAVLEESLDSLAGARRRSEEATRALHREESRMQDEQERLQREAKEADSKIEADIESLQHDIQNKRLMMEKYTRVTREQIRQERLQVATQHEKLRAASAAAAVKRQFAVEQAAERVLECKKAAAMADIVVETATDEHQRAIGEREEAIRKMNLLASQGQETCMLKIQELEQKSLDAAAAAKDGLEAEKLAMEAELQAKLTKISNGASASSVDVDSERLRLDHLVQALAAAQEALEAVQLRNAQEEQEASDVAVKAREAWDLEVHANNMAEAERERDIQALVDARDQARATLQAETEASQWETMKQNQKLHDDLLEAEGVKQAAKDLLQNQVLENEENMRKLEASMKDKEDQDAKSFNTRKAALEAEHEELTRIDAECADTLVGLDAACRAATHQVTACQGNLDSELHATNKAQEATLEHLAEDERKAMERLANIEADLRRAHEEEAESLNYQRKDAESRLMNAKRQTEMYLSQSNRQVAELTAALQQAENDQLKAQDEERAVAALIRDAKKEENRLSSVECEGQDATNLNFLQQTQQHFIQLQHEIKLAPNAHNKAERAVMVARSNLQAFKARTEKQYTIAMEAHSKAEQRLAALHDARMKAHLESVEASLEAMTWEREQVAASFTSQRADIQAGTDQFAESFAAHASALEAHKQSLEVKISSTARVEDRQVELNELRQRREAEKAFVLDRMFAEDDNNARARQASLAALAKQHEALFKMKEVETAKKLETAEFMREEAHRVLEQWKVDKGKRLVELQEMEVLEKAKLDAKRAEVDSQHKAWTEKVRAHSAAMESVRRLEVVAAKDRADRVNAANSLIRTRRQEVEQGEAKLEAVTRKAEASQHASSAETQAAKRSYQAMVESKTRLNAAQIDELHRELDAKTREARAEAQRKVEELQEMREKHEQMTADGVDLLQRKAASAQQAAENLKQAEAAEAEEKMRNELEEEAYAEMVLQEQESLTSESEQRVRELEDKLQSTSAAMEQDMALLDSKIQTAQSKLGLGYVEAARVAEAAAGHLEKLRATMREAVGHIKDEEAKLEPVRAAIAHASDRLQQAKMEHDRRVKELEKLKAERKKEHSNLDTDAEALDEASHLETTEMYEQFEKEMAKLEAEENERLRQHKVEVAEETLAQKRKLQRWIMERRTRCDIEVQAFKNELDDAKKMEADILDNLLNKQKEVEDERNERIKRLRMRHDRDRKAMQKRHQDDEELYEREMSDLMLAMERAKASLLAREAEEKQQEWMFKEAQASIANRQNAFVENQANQAQMEMHMALMASERVDWEHAQAAQQQHLRKAQRRVEGIIAPSTSAFPVPMPAAPPSGHPRRPSSRNNSRPSSAGTDHDAPSRWAERQVYQPPPRMPQIVYPPPSPQQEEAERMYAEFHSEKLRMQRELDKMSRLKASLSKKKLDVQGNIHG